MSPDIQEPYKPGTLDSRRREVRADTPFACSSPAARSRPSLPIRWAVMNASTSAGRICRGGLRTTVKKTYRS
jgi:hypothetical protein